MGAQAVLVQVRLRDLAPLALLRVFFHSAQLRLVWGATFWQCLR